MTNRLVVIAIIFAAFVVLYIGFVLVLVVSGRREQARAWAGFIPDCLVLFKRLLSDQRVSRWDKLLVGLTVAYLALPIDIVPDFIPVAGQLDDVIIVGLVLRRVLKTTDRRVIEQLWPGPQKSLNAVLRL